MPPRLEVQLHPMQQKVRRVVREHLDVRRHVTNVRHLDLYGQRFPQSLDLGDVQCLLRVGRFDLVWGRGRGRGSSSGSGGGTKEGWSGFGRSRCHGRSIPDTDAGSTVLAAHSSHHRRRWWCRQGNRSNILKEILVLTKIEFDMSDSVDLGFDVFQGCHGQVEPHTTLEHEKKPQERK